MEKTKRSIAEVLFPQVRARLLRLLFSVPPRQHYVRELANMSGLALHTVQDELRKLSAIELVTSSTRSFRRFYRANLEHPAYSHLFGIIQASEKLPRAEHSALHRPGRRKKAAQGRPKSLRPDRAIRWDLFSRRPEKS